MDKYRDLKKEIELYKGVVFDLDETLVNLNVDWLALKEELSVVVEKETGNRIEFTPLDQVVREIRIRHGNNLFVQLLEIISYFEMKEEKYELNDGLLEIFESLKDKRVAIYSMNTERCVKNFVEKYVSRKPDLIISKDVCFEPKPSDKDLKKILKEWNMRENDIVYIGNSENDRLSGEWAGVKTFIISF